ncbi:MAG: hypothetical protein DME50_10680 [Verrucomicrobia bacterium]|jgi:hypothetical protein|nr:MAG: hypothetical protein DME50_10680 [Verrucomicrobiota bacterium]
MDQQFWTVPGVDQVTVTSSNLPLNNIAPGEVFEIRFTLDRSAASGNEPGLAMRLFSVERGTMPPTQTVLTCVHKFETTP